MESANSSRRSSIASQHGDSKRVSNVSKRSQSLNLPLMTSNERKVSRKASHPDPIIQTRLSYHTPGMSQRHSVRSAPSIHRKSDQTNKDMESVLSARESSISSFKSFRNSHYVTPGDVDHINVNVDVVHEVNDDADDEIPHLVTDTMRRLQMEHETEVNTLKDQIETLKHRLQRSVLFNSVHVEAQKHNVSVTKRHSEPIILQSASFETRKDSEFWKNRLSAMASQKSKRESLQKTSTIPEQKSRRESLRKSSIIPQKSENWKFQMATKRGQSVCIASEERRKSRRSSLQIPLHGHTDPSPPSIPRSRRASFATKRTRSQSLNLPSKTKQRRFRNSEPVIQIRSPEIPRSRRSSLRSIQGHDPELNQVGLQKTVEDYRSQHVTPESSRKASHLDSIIQTRLSYHTPGMSQRHSVRSAPSASHNVHKFEMLPARPVLQRAMTETEHRSRYHSPRPSSRAPLQNQNGVVHLTGQRNSAESNTHQFDLDDFSIILHGKLRAVSPS